MKTKFTIVLYLLLSLVFKANAQDVSVNTELKTLVQGSFDYFPKFKEIQQGESISQERLKSTRSNLLPSVSGIASYSYVDPVSTASFPVGPGVEKTLQFQPNNNINAYLSLNYTLLDFGRLKAAIDKSREDLNFNKQNTELNKSQLAAQISTVYYNVIYLKKAIVIQDSVLAYYEQNKEVIESRLRNGDALKVDLYNIQSSIEAEKTRMVDLQNLLEKQLNLLDYTTGKKDVTTSDFDFIFSVKSPEMLLQTAQGQNSEFLMNQSRLNQSKLDLIYNKRQFMPTLSAVATAGVRNGYQPDILQNRFNYLAGLNLNLPIYAGGKNKAQVGIASQTVKQNEMVLASLSHTVKKDIEQALADVHANVKRMKNAEVQIQSAREVLLLTQSRYKNGVATYLDLSYATTALQRATLNKLQYQFQQCAAYIELARLTGTKYW